MIYGCLYRDAQYLRDQVGATEAEQGKATSKYTEKTKKHPTTKKKEKKERK